MSLRLSEVRPIVKHKVHFELPSVLRVTRRCGTYGIVCGIMTSKRLRRLQKRLQGLRGSPRKPRELEALAKAFGRTRAKRGKEPTWVSTVFPLLRPLSIPHHSGDLKRGTTESILDHLERFDLAAWEERLQLEGQT